MVEHSIRIRGVGGSIPPVSTSFFLRAFDSHSRGPPRSTLLFSQTYFSDPSVLWRRQLTFLLKKNEISHTISVQKNASFFKTSKKAP
jgi:hypothetical protein